LLSLKRQKTFPPLHDVTLKNRESD